MIEWKKNLSPTTTSKGTQNDNMYQLLGGARNNNDSEDDSALEENLLKLKNYTYFDGDKILASLKLSAKDKKNGEAIYRQNKVNISDISSGYSHLGERCGQADAVFNVGRDTFHTTIIFNNKEITYSKCYCPECSRKYWGWYSDNAKCQYTAALAFYIKDFVKQNNFADATDMNGNYLLSTYRKGQIKNTQKEQPAPSAPSVSLIPRLTQKDSQLSVSFKVGTDKLFVVKKLDDFCSQVHNSETVKYGTSTVISHKLQDFTEKSQKWIRFIDQIVREEARFVNKIEASGTYLPKKFNVGSSLGAVWLAPGQLL